MAVWPKAAAEGKASGAGKPKGEGRCPHAWVYPCVAHRRCLRPPDRAHRLTWCEATHGQRHDAVTALRNGQWRPATKPDKQQSKGEEEHGCVHTGVFTCMRSSTANGGRVLACGTHCNAARHGYVGSRAQRVLSDMTKPAPANKAPPPHLRTSPPAHPRPRHSRSQTPPVRRSKPPTKPAGRVSARQHASARARQRSTFHDGVTKRGRCRGGRCRPRTACWNPGARARGVHIRVSYRIISYHIGQWASAGAAKGNLGSKQDWWWWRWLWNRTMHGHGLREGQRHQHRDRRRHVHFARACVRVRVRVERMQGQ